MRRGPAQITLDASPEWQLKAKGHRVEPRWSRRQFGGLLAASGWAASTARASVTDSHKVRLGVSMRSTLAHFPLMLADQLGYFRPLGLQIEWHDFDSDAQAQQALVSGSVDVISADFEQVLELNEQGHKVKAFVLQGRTPQISLGIALRRLPEFQGLADLRRFKIGIADWGSPSHAMARLWCLQAGVPPRDNPLVVVGATSAAIENLRSGVVDALCYNDPLMSWLEYKSDLRVVAETRTLQGAQMWIGGACAATCLFAKNDWLQHKPELTQGLSDGVVRALKWLMTAGPTDLLKSVPPPTWMGDRAFYLGTVDKVRESFSLDGGFGDELLLTAWRSRALRLGWPRPSNADRSALQAAFTNEWVYKSKKRFAI
jgi:NitT/TauT family transport system substrate-binding protein